MFVCACRWRTYAQKSVHACTPGHAHGQGLCRWAHTCITEVHTCRLGCLQKDVIPCTYLWKHAGVHVHVSRSMVYLNECFPSILSSFIELKGREQMVHQSATCENARTLVIHKCLCTGNYVYVPIHKCLSKSHKCLGIFIYICLWRFVLRYSTSVCKEHAYLNVSLTVYLSAHADLFLYVNSPRKQFWLW